MTVGELTSPQLQRCAADRHAATRSESLKHFGTPPALDRPAEMRRGGLGPYAPGEVERRHPDGRCVAPVAATGADLTSQEALDRIAQNFLDWAQSGPSDIGNRTSMVLADARHREGSVGRRLAEATRAYTASSPRSAGNGALMRTAIVGLSSLGDRLATASAARAVGADPRRPARR